MEAKEVIESLLQDTQKLINEAETYFIPLTYDQLMKRTPDNGWSIGECLEHLNLYGEFYVPAFQNAINKSDFTKQEVYKPGIIGDYLAKSMLPKAGGTITNKMKTPANKNPAKMEVPENVVDRFISQQKDMIEILEMARNTNLNKVKVPLTISKHIRLRLGDMLRFIIYHNIRHMEQAKRQIRK